VVSYGSGVAMTTNPGYPGRLKATNHPASHPLFSRNHPIETNRCNITDAIVTYIVFFVQRILFLVIIINRKSDRCISRSWKLPNNVTQRRAEYRVIRYLHPCRET